MLFLPVSIRAQCRACADWHTAKVRAQKAASQKAIANLGRAQC